MEVVNRNLIKYEVGPAAQFEEGKIYPFTIKNGENDYKIILIKFNGRIYALSSTCTYDQETDLSKGICFGNKLYCPKHGCQFDITNGWADQAPAFDYLPQFYIEEKNGIISVLAPKIVPRKILP